MLLSAERRLPNPVLLSAVRKLPIPTPTPSAVRSDSQRAGPMGGWRGGEEVWAAAAVAAADRKSGMA